MTASTPSQSICPRLFSRVDRVALLALVAVIVTPFVPALLSGAMPYFMDTLMQFFPFRRMAAGLIYRGVLPFWNPSMFGGVPLLANPQVGVLYPGHWLFMAWPTAAMFTATAVLHVVIAATGVYGLARWLGCSRMSAWFGAMVAAWSGWTWAHFAFGSFHQVWAWWPWQWWLLLAWARRGGEGWKRVGVALGVLAALQILAGAPQLVFYSGIGSGALLAVAWATGPRPRRAALGRLGAGVGVAVVLAAGWSAPQLLPTRAFFEECARTQSLDLLEIRGGALGVGDLARAFVGGTGFPEDAESTAYLSEFWLALAVVGLWAARKRRGVLLLAIPAIVGGLLAWRRLTPLWCAVIPGFSHMHDPRRALALAAVALPVLAAWGLENLCGEEETKRRGRGWLLLAAVVAGIFAFGRWAIGVMDSPLPPEGMQLQPALGWLGPLRFLPGIAVAAVSVALAVALALVYRLPEVKTPGDESPGHSALSRGGGLGVRVAAAWGLLILLGFAANRIDLKMIGPEGKGGILGDIRAAGTAMNAAGSPREAAASTPIRFFAYDPTGHYSYDYTRPQIGRWLFPDLAALTWRAGAPGAGVCDAQGYDPSLPRRMAALVAAINEGHIALYTRHFALVRAPRSPLLPRLGAGVALGPVDRYVLPILPPVLNPDKPRVVPVEEASDFARLRIEAQPDGICSGTLEVSLVDSARRPLVEREYPIVSREERTQRLVFVEPLASGAEMSAVALRLRWASMRDMPPLGVLAALEWASPPPGIQALDRRTPPPSTDSASTLDSPTPWKLTTSLPYAWVTSRVELVPPGEEPGIIARRMQRSPDAAVLEWPEDFPAPPAQSHEAPLSKESGRASVARWAPGHVELDADVEAPDGAALVVREPYFRGWSVRIDGRRHRPIPADLAFQAVWVPQGTHRVVWHYRPVGFAWGLLAALIATLLAAGLVISARAEQKRAAAIGTPPVTEKEGA